MTRPEWVEAGAQALVGGTNYVMSGDNGVAGTMNRLTAEFVIRAVESLIRADERERREEFWEARWREAAEQREQAWTDLARAETVAARLVEVIGRQHVSLQAERRYIVEVDRALAGRTAEVEALRDSLDNLRAQIAADIEALHSDYDPSGSGDRWHACQDQREHDLLERCEAIARGDA